MKCLNECQMDILKHFQQKPDAGCPAFHCAAALPSYSSEEIETAIRVLHSLGLIRDIGTNTANWKLGAGVAEFLALATRDSDVGPRAGVRGSGGKQ